MRDETIHLAIEQRVSHASDSALVADAVVELLRLLHLELAAVVGAQAAAALCAHAIHRTRSRVQWTIPGTVAVSDRLFAALREDLCVRTAAAATSAGHTLLRTLVDHLISLIGESLTHRMLHAAWNPPSGQPLPEKIDG